MDGDGGDEHVGLVADRARDASRRRWAAGSRCETRPLEVLPAIVNAANRGSEMRTAAFAVANRWLPGASEPLKREGPFEVSAVTMASSTAMMSSDPLHVRTSMRPLDSVMVSGPLVVSGSRSVASRGDDAAVGGPRHDGARRRWPPRCGRSRCAARVERRVARSARRPRRCCRARSTHRSRRAVTVTRSAHLDDADLDAAQVATRPRPGSSPSHAW